MTSPTLDSVTTTLPNDLGHRQPWHVARRMGMKAFTLFPLLAATLFLGMALYHWIEKLPWADAFLNASMLLGGMGPIDRINTAPGKWLIGAYALFAGLVFIVTAGIMLGPVVHAVLHRFHLEQDQSGE